MSEGLVEREAEARTVAEFLSQAQTDPTGLVVEGEAGIGKTVLALEAVSQAAARGFRVLLTRGSPAEVSYAYAAVADLLSGIGDDVLAGLPKIQCMALTRARSGEVSSGPGTDERLVAAAFSALIEHLSGTEPVLLVIDDAQWLDPSSRAVIGFTVRRLSGRVGMFITIRAGDPDSSDMQWLQFRRPDAVLRVRLRPLTLGGVHTLVARRLGRTLPRPNIVRIHEISGGNPLFAMELAVATAEDASAATVVLPDTLASLVHRRIGQADPATNAILLAAACSAAPTVELLAAATGMIVTRIVEMLEPMEDLGVIEISADRVRVRFTHPLYATGVYTGATPARRRAMHRTLATIIEQPELKARHLALAATSADPATVAALDAAAEVTAAQGAPVAAAELLELAMKLGGDEPARRLRTAEHHFRSGNTVRADAALDDATFRQLEGFARTQALIVRAGIRIYTSSHLEAADLLAQAAKDAKGIPAMLAAILVFLSHAQLNAGQYHAALDSAEQAVTQAEEWGHPGYVSQALAARTNARFHCGHGVDEHSLRRSLELQDHAADMVVPLSADAISAMIRAWSGQLDEAHALMQQVRTRCTERGADTEMLWVEINSTLIAIWRGHFAEAANAADEAVQRAQQLGGDPVMAVAFTLRTAVAAYAGREEDARADAAVAIALAQKSKSAVEVQRPIETLAFLEISAGRHAEALAIMQPRLEGWNELPGTEFVTAAFIPYAVEALTALGRHEEAEPLLATLEENGGRLDRPWMLTTAARGRAQVFAARGDLDAAEVAAEQAMAHHDRLPMPFERAWTQLLLGGLQRRMRRIRSAATNLRAALEAFEQLGTPLWAARAQAELDRLEQSRGSGAGLTVSEQRVADLAAGGLSNKEIAAELFISAKTVEMNLSRVYRKLGIRSRAGLSAALVEAKLQGNP